MSEWEYKSNTELYHEVGNLGGPTLCFAETGDPDAYTYELIENDGTKKTGRMKQQ